MNLGSLFSFSISSPKTQADFYICRSGSLGTVGKPTRKYRKDFIAVTVKDKAKIIPEYAFYMFEYMHTYGHFAEIANGTLELQHISIEDVSNIEIRDC